MTDGLLVLIPYRLSEVLEKGEVVERYYNPGNLFARVDIVITADDDPDEALVAPMVGDAELHLHRVPIPDGMFRRTLGFRPRLVGPWTDQVVDIARRVRPALVRCHSAHLNALAARRIRERLGVPYAVSLHINPDEDVRGRAHSLTDRARLRAMEGMERAGLRGADVVLPVYESIVPYLKRMGVERYEVAYNVVGGSHLRKKSDYTLHDPVRVISVGRLIPAKNPENLIRAVGELDGVELLIVGDGELHGQLSDLAGESVRFAGSMPNAEVCGRLAESDVFATHSEHWELSKGVIEALLTGLPVVHNRRRGPQVPELEDGICRLVDDSVEGYRAALSELVDDDAARGELGRRGRSVAESRWAPDRTEEHFVAIYRRLLDRAPRIPSPA